MNHLTTWPLLDRFLDGTLERESRWAVAAHLAECATCQTYLAEQAHMRAFVRDRLSRVAMPEALADRVQATIREAKIDQPLFRWTRFWRNPLAVASLAVLLVLSWGFLSSLTPGPNLGVELATSHRLFAQDETLLEVTGTQAEIQRWLQARVPFSVVTPNVPEYTFLGGRIVAINAQRAVQLVYENEPMDQYLSLLYFEAPLTEDSHLKPAGPFKVGQYSEITVVAWSGEQVLTALVADQPVAELLPLAHQIRE